MAYIFDQDGTPIVFASTPGPEATDADADAVSSIVQSFEFTPH